MLFMIQPKSAKTNLIEHALGYAARGWSIIPIIGKRAAGLWKPFQEQPADEKTLRAMFARPGITGLAVITGKVSGGLAVRDFDLAEAYNAWSRANPDDAAILPTVKTARGFHVYGRLEDDIFADLGDGELRGNSRHYVLLPPSLHPDGSVYLWKVPLPEGSLPRLPVSLTRGEGSQTQSQPTTTHDYTLHVLHGRNVESAIAATLPTAQGQRNRKLFDLARILKGLIPAATPEKLREIVQHWFALALPVIGTKDWSTTWSDFVHAWKQIRFPAGRCFQAAVAAAENDIPAVAYRYDGNLRRLVSLCWHLQAQQLGRPFPLSCRKAGKFLGVSHVQAWRDLRTLEFDGILKLIKKGKEGTHKNDGSEWVFVKPGSASGDPETLLACDNEIGPYQGDRL
jgi:hypothetical protein